MKEGNIGCPRRGCSCHIKCITATFLAALMWRGPVNSAALATTTHRKIGECPMRQALKWGSKWSTSVKPWWLQEDYIRKGSPHELGDGEKRKLEQKNGARTIVCEQWPVFIPYVFSDQKSIDMKGIFIFN